MKSLGSICSKWTSEYKQETLLSLSFLLDRLIPAALYFMPVLIIARYGNLEQISMYAIFSSLFTSFISIPVGFTSAIRYYSSLSTGNSSEPYSRQSALALTSIVSALSVISYLVYYHVVLADKGYSSQWMLYLFALSLCCVAPYYAYSSFNEGRKEVRVNNLCGMISLPVFIASCVLLSFWLNIMFACTAAFLITRIVMLVVLVSGTGKVQSAPCYTGEQVVKTFKYGISIASLFFVQKLVSTLILGALSDKDVDVAAFQIITIISMMLSLVSNATSTTVFIKIVRKESNLVGSIMTTLFNAGVVYIATCTVLWFAIIVQGYHFVSDSNVMTVLSLNLKLSLAYFLFDMLMTAAFILSRACGDTWRSQLAWCVCMGLFFISKNSGITINDCIYALIVSDMICIAVSAISIIKFNQRNLVINRGDI